ncbi:ComEC family competence protein [mine drainage metagenome]|uniref:ComEC family competence protein n=1 Tax=mine drainage metagenome TaxID=410659 RepID=A0A1J5SFL8_9ZZZZ
MGVMRLSIICFALGVVALQQQAELPEPRTLVLLATAAALLRAAGRSRRLTLPLTALLLGYAWAAGIATLRLADALPAALEGRDLHIAGVVSKLPQRVENGTRFDFAVESADAPVPAHISLAWYPGWRREAEEEALPAGAPEVHAGERWRLTVRLKRPHGSLNPDGFDFEAWLLEAGIRATGLVRPAPDNRRLDAFVLTPGNLVESLREAIRGRIFAALPEAPYAGVLVALAVGDQQAIGSGQWQLFARTGITHLMSISGLHVTMLAGLAYLLMSWLWRKSPALMLRLPAQKAAVIGGFFAALGYCLLAGFAVPAQRTLYMLAVVAIALLTNRHTSVSRVLALALLLVLLVDPWAVLAAGFWLSFGAVAVLFYADSGRLGVGHWLGSWARAQWAVTAAMTPALLLLFQQFSLVSPLANAIAIPVVSFVVTPLVLAAAALPQLDFLLLPAHGVISWLMALMNLLADSPWAVWQQPAPPLWTVLAALLGGVWLLAPRGLPGRSLGAVMMLPMLLTAPSRPAPGEALITTLDVGQGLALHVQTARHDLIFDTGPRYSTQADSGNRIILPYLRSRGVTRIDGLIVSHQDNDHAGGAASLLGALPVGWLASSLPAGHALPAAAVRAIRCQDGQRWQWDGVSFVLLHPAADQYQHAVKQSNDLSCVLRVGNAHGSVLATADIENATEAALLLRHRLDLASEVVIVPHHGSRSASSQAFISAVGARAAIFSVGYRNRFHHPNAAVWERYRASGAMLYRTDRDGALSLRLAASGPVIVAEREARRRYWHGR